MMCNSKAKWGIIAVFVIAIMLALPLVPGIASALDWYRFSVLRVFNMSDHVFLLQNTTMNEHTYELIVGNEIRMIVAVDTSDEANPILKEIFLYENFSVDSLYPRQEFLSAPKPRYPDDSIGIVQILPTDSHGRILLSFPKSRQENIWTNVLVDVVNNDVNVYERL